MAHSPFLSYALLGLGGTAAVKAITPPKVQTPTLPDFSTLLAQIPTAASTSKDEEALAKKRIRRANAPTALDQNILTGPLGASGNASTQRKTLLGM